MGHGLKVGLCLVEVVYEVGHCFFVFLVGVACHYGRSVDAEFGTFVKTVEVGH